MKPFFLTSFLLAHHFFFLRILKSIVVGAASVCVAVTIFTGSTVTTVAQPTFQSANIPTDKNLTEELQCEHIGIEQGLSQGSALCMVQDKRGFIWVGTQDGLNRYDGYTFSVYRYKYRDSTSLAGNFIYGLLETRNGELWAATNEGLCRYNPLTESFVRYVPTITHPTDTRSIVTSSARSLAPGAQPVLVLYVYEDRRGMLWLGTLGSGLVRFDRQSETFTYFKHSEVDASTVNSNNVYCVSETKNGELWVGTDKGVCRFDRTNSRAERFTANSSVPRSIAEGNVRALCEDRAGMVWIGTFDKGLVRYNQANKRFTSYTYTADNVRSGATIQAHNEAHNQARNCPAGQPFTAQNVRFVYEDRTGLVWIATKSGLYCYHRETDTFALYTHDPTNLFSLRSNNILSILEDRAGTLWFGSGGNGIHWWNRSLRKFRTLRRNPYNERAGLPSNPIRSLLQDQKGLFWIGTTEGLCLYDPVAKTYTAFRYRPDDAKSLPDNDVLSLCQDHTGTLWVGTFAGGLCSYKPNATLGTPHTTNGVFTRYSADTLMLRPFTAQPTVLISPHTATQFTPQSQTQSAMLGAASAENSLRATNSAESRAAIVNSSFLNEKSIFVIREDRTHTLWIGTLTMGLVSYNRDTKTFTQYFYTDPATGSKRSFGAVRAIAEDSTGTLWIGTAGAGLYALTGKNRRTGEFSCFLHNPDDSTTIASNIVSALHADKHGVLWIATDGGGLNRMEIPRSFATDAVAGTANKCVFYDCRKAKNGPQENVVYAVLEDEQAHLWLSTNRGLLNYAAGAASNANAVRNEPPCRRYDISDGLLGNEFNRGAYLKTRDGELMFGGMEGVVAFNPALITGNTFVPPVVLTAYKQFNQVIPLDTSISERHELTLSYKDIGITFEFAALNFINPHKNQYAYKLEGFDPAWINAGTQRVASYTNLPPGEYTFRVRASNNDDVWNMNGTSIRLIVTPPWWKTWWSYTLACCAVVCMLAAAYYTRIRFVKRQNQRLKELVHQRTEELQASLLEIASRNHEIQRQNGVLADQARAIEMTNAELQTINSSLMETNEQLHELNQEKSEFLGIAAHDLRNPLGSILMSLENIRRYHHKMNAEMVSQTHDNITRTASRMMEIINNLLDVNAIETGLQLNRVQFEAAPLIREVIDEHMARAAQKGINIHFTSRASDHAPERAVTIFADRAMTGEAVDNLLSNALKYSPNWRNIWLTLEQQNNKTRLSIRDEGPGLSEEDKAQLFRKFTRLSARPTGGEHSTGLGLFIVKKIVEAMNGLVWCESEVGAGATFVLLLPAVEAPSERSLEQSLEQSLERNF